MRKTLILASVAVVLFSVSFVGAKHFWRGETMSEKQVCKTWPTTLFDSEKFKVASEVLRASMSCSLLKTQSKFIGKDRSEIRKELGDFDGFYFSDMFPAYMIQSGKSRDEDSWQIVFLLNKNEKVSEIIVHKNCCD